jgi:hypothetical protein
MMITLSRFRKILDVFLPYSHCFECILFFLSLLEVLSQSFFKNVELQDARIDGAMGSIMEHILSRMERVDQLRESVCDFSHSLIEPVLIFVTDDSQSRRWSCNGSEQSIPMIRSMTTQGIIAQKAVGWMNRRRFQFDI